MPIGWCCLAGIETFLFSPFFLLICFFLFLLFYLCFVYSRKHREGFFRAEPLDKLHRAKLHRAKLHRAKLHRAKLHRAKLHRAKLHRAKLHRAKLHRAKLHRAKLHRAKLHRASGTEPSYIEPSYIARDPLRRFARSKFKNWGLFTISAGRARPSAEIRVVEVQKLRAFYDFCGPRAALCGDRALSLWRRANLS